MNMRGKKLFASIIMSVIVICLFLGQKETFATTDNFWVDIKEEKQATNTAYAIGNPDSADRGEHVWELVPYTDQTGLTTVNKKLYCVKAGVSKTWNDASTWNDPLKRRVNYTNGYDLKLGKSEINSFVPDSKSIYKEIITSNYYNQILWIIDNMYIPGTGEGKSTLEDRDALLKAAKIDISAYPEDIRITDDDIEAVQQLALWYYTNHNEEKYTYEEEINNALWIKNSITGSSWEQLSNFRKFSDDTYKYGPLKAAQMDSLYKYLIATAEANKDNYVEKDSSDKDLNQLKAPITISKNTITAVDFDNNYYKVGPINITRNNNLPYKLELKVTNGSGTEASEVSYINENGSNVDINNLKFTNNQTTIYVKVPKTIGKKINIDATTNYKTSTATYWLPGALPVNEKGEPEQPIIEVNKNPHSELVQLQTEIDERPFDLALRKFITTINGKTDTFDSRIPQFGEWQLDDGKTIEKKHTKTPLRVATNDIVLYTIRIYNEGEVDGTATKITDYLPEGLEFIESQLNTDNGWTNPSGDKKTLVTEKLKNETISARKENTNPEYKDVQVECKVVATKSSEGLKNIAEITEDYNEEGIKDRDSTVNNLTGTQKSSYNPSTATQGKGYEDDDDYENLVLKPFDLALRKFITAIAPQGDMDKLYNVDSRVPQLDGNWGTGKDSTTLNKEHRKDALPVKQGDYVLYTIRVYNEGEVDGYASLIEDHFQEGLQFVNSMDEKVKAINGIWTINASDNRSITTDWLAKGKGAELDGSTANLIKALKKDEDGKVQVSTVDPLNPDYRDVQVILEVTESNESNRTLDNRAQIADDSDKDGNPVEDIDSTPNEWIDGEDDQDHDPVKLQYFDLALRKFISKVDGENIQESREPNVDATDLSEGKTTTAEYNHTKTPLKVNKNSIITYELRVYNEGDVDGYASKITDHLPEYLEVVPDSRINDKYGWEISEDGRTATTDYLAPKEGETSSNDTTKIKAREGEKLYYKPIEIECRIKDNVDADKYITNIAEITEYRQYISDTSKPIINPDRDSHSNSLIDGKDETGKLPNDNDLPDYKQDEIESGKAYIPGQEDDDDFEKIYIEKPKYDLALRKFITKIAPQGDMEKTYDVETREPTIKMDGQRAVWENDNGTTATKQHTKTPVAVAKGDIVRYTIRVYNEGEVEGTAKEITDYLPEGLEFVSDSEINQKYGWQVDGKTITTNYLKDEKIRALNDYDGMMTGLFGIPQFLDVEIECKVVADKLDGYNLRNIAAITEDDGDDIDSNPKENPNNETYKPEAPENGKGEQDDDDFEDLVIKTIDLALRKFITSIDGNEISDREPQIDITKLADGTSTTAIYNHSKQPLAVKKGSTIIYTLRVYNEGQLDGYASSVTDYLPEYLEFVKDSKINEQYGWYEDDGAYTTEYLIANDKLLSAFNGTVVDFEDLKIECRVKENATIDKKITNIAEIAGYKDANKVIVNPDRDSTSSNIKMPEDLPGYKDEEIKSGEKYIPGQEDDDDFEKVYIPKFDLALRKFITNVSGTEETSRIPQVDASKLVSGESTTATYTHPKEPVNVVVGDIVTYTIRVYNEGEVAGYAEEVADDIPEHLIFLPENEINTEYGWKMYDEHGDETTDVSKAKTIKTTYLSKENGLLPQVIDPETGLNVNPNLIHAFDPTKEVSDSNPEYKDVKVAFKVDTSAEVNKVITNMAQVEKNTDSNGDPVDDIDSTPGKWIEGEDDQDIENIIPSIFDLSLIKYVSQVQVTEGGKTTTTNTNNTGNNSTDIIPKVEIHKKKLNSTTVKFIYTIQVTNEGDIPGYAKEVTDYIPEGLKFEQGDNPNWTVKGDGMIATRALENTLLQPGDSAPVTVVFTWINGANNLGLKRNYAEISEDYNDKHVPDRDSTPNNRVEGEDDIDYADVLLSIKTGKAVTYIVLAGTVLIVLASGIILIRKYVL